jgi:hypothetical protein
VTPRARGGRCRREEETFCSPPLNVFLFFRTEISMKIFCFYKRERIARTTCARDALSSSGQKRLWLKSGVGFIVTINIKRPPHPSTPLSSNSSSEIVPGHLSPSRPHPPPPLPNAPPPPLVSTSQTFTERPPRP